MYLILVIDLTSFTPNTSTTRPFHLNSGLLQLQLGFLRFYIKYIKYIK